MCQTVGGAQASWRLPCLPGRAEERMEEGGKLASSAGAAERRRSKGPSRVGCRFCWVLTPLSILGGPLRVVFGSLLFPVPQVLNALHPATTPHHEP